MPIYIKFDGVKGTVTDNDHKAGSSTGGVWKTTNFLTSEPVSVSRISMASGSVDAQEALPTRKAAELFGRAGRSAPGGKLYVATDVGVFTGGSQQFDGQGRLLVGTDGGAWSKGGLGGNGALMSLGGNNTWAGDSRPGVGLLKSTESGRTWNSFDQPMKWDNVTNKAWSGSVPVVEIFVSDRGSASGRTFKLKNVTIAPGAGGTLELSYSSIEM